MTTTSATGARRWHRFSLTERIMRSVFYLMALLAIVWSIRSIEIIPEFLYDAPQQTADLFARMWPIDWAWYPKVVHAALLETLHIATLGTVLAVLIASLVALRHMPFCWIVAANSSARMSSPRTSAASAMRVSSAWCSPSDLRMGGLRSHANVPTCFFPLVA